MFSVFIVFLIVFPESFFFMNPPSLQQSFIFFTSFFNYFNYLFFSFFFFYFLTVYFCCNETNQNTNEQIYHTAFEKTKKVDPMYIISYINVRCILSYFPQVEHHHLLSKPEFLIISATCIKTSCALVEFSMPHYSSS